MTDLSLTDQLELSYLVSQNDLSGRLNRPLIGWKTILDMPNIFVKNAANLMICQSGVYFGDRKGNKHIVGPLYCDIWVSTTQL